MSHAPRTGGAGIDFAKLYAELGVAPDCGLEAFKQAYRRRVAELHPDRPAAANRDPERLVALNLGYAAALDFHRSQGRIPGAPLPSSAAPRQPPRLHTAGVASAAPSAATATAASRRVPRMRVLILPVMLIIAAIWRWLPTFDAPPAASPAAPAARPGTEAPGPAHVRLGMDRHTVIALIGEPMSRDAGDSHWIYGPSWLRFECSRLVDWYSSPLRPLRVATRTPTDEQRASLAAASPPCLPRTGTAMHHFHEDA